MAVLDQFPLLAEALQKWEQEFREKLLSEIKAGEWLDQTQSVLGRNKHVRACQRLIRRDSADAYYDASAKRWLLRACAVDKEIRRINRAVAEQLPPPAPAPVKAPAHPWHEVAPEDETGVYEREWLEKLRVPR